MDAQLMDQVKRLAAARSIQDKVKSLEAISKLFQWEDTDPALIVVQSTNLIQLLARALNEDRQWINTRCDWSLCILNSIFRCMRWDVPKEQIVELMHVLKQYILINDSEGLGVSMLWHLVHSINAKQAAMEDSTLYDILKKKAIQYNLGVFQVFHKLTTSEDWKLKILEDKQFVLDVINCIQAAHKQAISESVDVWAFLGSICTHPDAKTLLPTELILQQVSATRVRVDYITSVTALISNEKDLVSITLGVNYLLGLLKILEHLVTTKHQKNLAYDHLLAETIPPLVNLSIVDTMKDEIGKGFISVLLQVVAITTDKPLSHQVSMYLHRSKQGAAKTLWNLAFLEANRTRIQCNRGIETLKAVIRASKDEALNMNIEGVLFMLTKDNPQLSIQPSVPPGTSPATTSPSGSQSAQPTKHVMISYNWANQKTVKRLAKSLKDQGYNIWLDIDQMKGSVLEAMAGAIEGADMVLMCVTQKYKDSPNCRLEGEYCLKRNVPFVPLLMQSGYKPDGWLGIAIGNKLYFNFSNETDWDSKISSLVKAIGICGKGVPITDTPTREKATTDAVWTPEELYQWMQKSNIGAYYELFIKHKIDKETLLELKALLLSPQNALPYLQVIFSEMIPAGDLLRITLAIRKL